MDNTALYVAVSGTPHAVLEQAPSIGRHTIHPTRWRDRCENPDARLGQLSLVVADRCLGAKRENLRLVWACKQDLACQLKLSKVEVCYVHSTTAVKGQPVSGHLDSWLPDQTDLPCYSGILGSPATAGIRQVSYHQPKTERRQINVKDEMFGPD
eukprot:6489565-Amphidinium_carterae.1